MAPTYSYGQEMVSVFFAIKSHVLSFTGDMMCTYFDRIYSVDYNYPNIKHMVYLFQHNAHTMYLSLTECTVCA